MEPAEASGSGSSLDKESGNDSLRGIRVLELAQYIAGPYAGTLLADFGADVIKVERPGHPDPGRYLGGVDSVDANRSPWWVTIGRGKRAISLDYTSPRGRQLLLDLIAESDVLIESFRPGAMESWGLSYGALYAAQPGLVYLRVSGYGQTGPLKGRPGYDRIAQAFGGLGFLTGEPSGDPVVAGLPIADYGSGVFGALGVVLAIHARDHCLNGKGQVIDHALFDSILPFLGDIPHRFVTRGEVRTRDGNRHPRIAPGGSYPTSDGIVFMVSTTSGSQYERFMEKIGLGELLMDQRYSTPESRATNRDDLDRAISEQTERFASQELSELLLEADVPHSRFNSIEDLVASDHLKHRESFFSAPDPAFGEVVMPSPRPLLLSTPGSVGRSAPQPGEDNAEVYSSILGFSDSYLEELHESGSI